MADAVEKDEVKSSAGRWWELYVVRYALGTVFGVLIVNILVKSGLALPFPNGSISEIAKPEGIPLLIGYGLAYCYLASAPILVFHAARFSMRRPAIRRSTVIFIVTSIGLAYTWAWAADMRNLTRVSYGLAILTIAMVSFLALIQFRALYYGLARNNDMWSFYRALDKNRRVKANWELVESYRHLREHGNAFFVVLLELLLGLGIYVSGKISVFPAEGIIACQPKDEICASALSTGLIQTIVLILIWIIPAAIVWSIGCVLESEFANDTSIGPQP